MLVGRLVSNSQGLSIVVAFYFLITSRSVFPEKGWTGWFRGQCKRPDTPWSRFVDIDIVHTSIQLDEKKIKWKGTAKRKAAHCCWNFLAINRYGARPSLIDYNFSFLLLLLLLIFVIIIISFFSWRGRFAVISLFQLHPAAIEMRNTIEKLKKKLKKNHNNKNSFCPRPLYKKPAPGCQLPAPTDNW